MYCFQLFYCFDLEFNTAFDFDVITWRVDQRESKVRGFEKDRDSLSCVFEFNLSLPLFPFNCLSDFYLFCCLCFWV